jgi:hypothetical protein
MGAPSNRIAERVSLLKAGLLRGLGEPVEFRALADEGGNIEGFR